MATTSRKAREVQQRELHLMDVARGMLIARGYAGLSMDRLAEATEYSKGTVYQHVSTKEDLMMALAASCSPGSTPTRSGPISNRRLAAMGIEPMTLAGQLGYRNINMPGGSVELPEQTISVKPSGPYRESHEIGESVIDVRDGYPLYLRDLAGVVRGYQDPPRTLNS